MSTLADLQAEIADDLDRTDLTSQIASEITKAIRHYQRTRFYFNETRDETFTTVAAQASYGVDDAAFLPKIIEIDQMFVEDGGEPFELDQISPIEWQALTASGSATGRPDSWVYYNQKYCLYPIPNKAYTIRPMCHIMVDAPASDTEEDNEWMNEAFDLIRARVCAMLGLRKLRDSELVQLHQAAELSELNRIIAETASKVGTGFVTPTDF